MLSKNLIKANQFVLKDMVLLLLQEKMEEQVQQFVVFQKIYIMKMNLLENI